MSDRSKFTVIDAIREPRVFGPAFMDLSTWSAWLRSSQACSRCR
jgi:hypothetical protein